MVRRGFTLVEMVMALAVAAVLMGALGSAFVLASRAVPDGSHPGDRIAAEAGVLRMMNAELAHAVSFTGATASAVEFAVADRDGDGRPETIRYAWGGRPGDPLTRTYNGGSADPVAANVRSFALSYDLLSRITAAGGAESDGAEILLASYDDAGATGAALSSSLSIAQFFVPTLPAGSSSWSVTRVQAKLATSGSADGSISVQLRKADSSGVPTSTILFQKTVLESALGSSPAFYEVAVSGVAGVSPQTGLCLMVVHSSGFQSCQAWRKNPATPPAYCVASYSNDGGSTWLVSSQMARCFKVYGKPASTSGGSVELRTVQAVNATLVAGSDSAPAVRTSVAITAAPEAPKPW